MVIDCSRCGANLPSPSRVCRSCGAVVRHSLDDPGTSTAGEIEDLEATVDRSRIAHLVDLAGDEPMAVPAMILEESTDEKSLTRAPSRYCTACGGMIEAEQKFCTACGKPVGAASVGAVSEAPSLTLGEPPPSVPSMADPEPSEPAPTDELSGFRPVRPATRNKVGAPTMAASVGGLICLMVGIYLATITRIYLFTGKTTHPYLAIGIVLAVIGVAAIGGAQLIAKQKLRR